jgi:two-component system, OmpR family, KDP operon response regulator KdpE
MHCTILVVDEDPIIRSTCRVILSSAGYTVLEAPDGATGLQMARLHRPALVTLGHPTRVARGGDLLTALRGLDGDPIKVLILSRWMEDLIGTGREDLFERSLGKPIHPERFLAAVQELLGPAGEEIAQPMPEPPPL